MATGVAVRLDVEATLLALQARAPSPRPAARPVPAASLPATGSFPGALIATGTAALLAGVALVLTVRRGSGRGMV
jgi:LPXTG-motif cell wall-anchored protein